MLKNFKSFVNESVQQLPRITPLLQELLNKQILNELESSQIYRAMSSWLDDKGWIGGSSLYFKYSDEELEHMKEIYKYMFEKNCKANVPSCSEVQKEFIDVKEVLTRSLEHEMVVSEQWNTIAECAKECKDNDTYLFAQKFIKEQREEEEKFRNLLFKVDLEMPKWKLDELFEQYK